MPDLKTVKQLLIRYGVHDPISWQHWVDYMSVVEVSSGEAITRTGDQQQFFYLIVQGAVRFYYLLPNGKEWNKSFFHEGQLIGSLSAQLTQSPCRFTIEAVESCILYRIPIGCIEKLPRVQEVLQQLTQELFLRNESREAILLTGDAEARYRWLEEHEPWLLERSIPQYHLASYLGMDAVSLSRLKRKLRVSK